MVVIILLRVTYTTQEKGSIRLYLSEINLAYEKL